MRKLEPAIRLGLDIRGRLSHHLSHRECRRSLNPRFRSRLGARLATVPWSERIGDERAGWSHSDEPAEWTELSRVQEFYPTECAAASVRRTGSCSSHIRIDFAFGTPADSESASLAIR